MNLRPIPVLIALLGFGCADDIHEVAHSTLALAEHEGDSTVDQRIRKIQGELRKRPTLAKLEQLGWSFVAKARRSYDEGWYRYAQACADWMQQLDRDAASGKLLRGHVLHSMHRFAEAERIARELTAARDGVFDHGLLGDVLLDRGRLKEAIASYQRMLDLRPCLQSYARAAHARWLLGDHAGARQLNDLALRSGSQRAPEALAWVHVRQARALEQLGDTKGRDRHLEDAMRAIPGYAPALLLQGLAARGRDAVAQLREAARRNPLPEYQWALADGLHDVGQEQEAREVEAELERHGAEADPRTYAVYLVTRGRRLDEAQRLIDAELEARRDVFTLDAKAWLLHRQGRSKEAAELVARIAKVGTRHPRLDLHRALILRGLGRAAEAASALQRAQRDRVLLMPSERRLLDEAMTTH